MKNFGFLMDPMDAGGWLRHTTRNYDLPEDGGTVIDEVVDSLSRWQKYASAAGVPDRMVEHLECRFERFP
ncbi:MAG: hypothetical protein OXE73_01665 [Gammaproteobacteria bacterium]|nr:hypothetical protein [Gammaproteobacteria bacterium]